MSTALQEGPLLADLKAGKSHAFEQLYRDAYPKIANMIQNNKGKTEDAQDVFQETLIVFVRSIQKPDFKLSAKISTYLYSIAYRLWLKKLRDRNPTATIEKDGKTMDMPDAGELALEEKRQYEQKHILMAKVLEQLKEDCRQLLKRFYFKRQPLSEIAEAMNYTGSFVKLKKSRCMNAFKQKIQAAPEFKNI